MPQPQQPEPQRPYNHRDHGNHFNLSIARLMLDFPTFSGEEPFNWLHLYEKYF
jgi:hypothetical protein